jgi:hypothetical protein
MFQQSHQIARGILKVSTSPFGLWLGPLVHDCQLTYISQFWEEEMVNYGILSYYNLLHDWDWMEWKKWEVVIGIMNFTWSYFPIMLFWDWKHDCKWPPWFLSHSFWMGLVNNVRKKVWCPSLICSPSLYMVLRGCFSQTNHASKSL